MSDLTPEERAYLNRRRYNRARDQDRAETNGRLVLLALVVLAIVVWAL